MILCGAKRKIGPLARPDLSMRQFRLPSLTGEQSAGESVAFVAKA
jgi:hypothetical protein